MLGSPLARPTPSPARRRRGVLRGLAPTFTFESGPVRPVALSPDGTRLFVANTSNASLDVFAITDDGVTLEGTTYVGIDPVAVAARTNSEVWVVNQVSDSISIVEVDTSPPHVTRTLLAGDEPSDIVFGGDGGTRAFITTAHRGQQRSDPSLAAVPGAGDPQLTTASNGRADVWVFDATTQGNAVGHALEDHQSLRRHAFAAAVSPDGGTVYVAIFKSGNQTMVESSESVCPGFDSADAGGPCTYKGITVPGAPPGPATNHAGLPAPQVGMILKADATGTWRDVLGRDWSSGTRFSLPDEDVFAIDAVGLAATASYLHVGTTLFNLEVNPVNGSIYVSNTEARNDRRFEGPGTFAGETVQGHLAESRITVLSTSGVAPRHLNKHIDYSVLPAPAGTSAHSLATPLQIAVSSDGATLYVAAFGSSKIGVFPTQAIEDDSFDPVAQSAAYLNVSGGGPAGIALDEAHHRIYVTTRFDDGLSVIDLTSGRETAHLMLENPEPAVVTSGRPFLYDALKTSSNGEAACASCHMFGDKDNLAWDLGNPDADAVVTPLPIKPQGGCARDHQRRRRPRHVASDEGADDHPDPARHGQRGTDALARRPGLGLLRVRPEHRATLRFPAGLQELHRGLQQLERPGAELLDHRHADLHRLRARHRDAPQPGTRSGQQPQRDAVGGPRLLSGLRRPGQPNRPARHLSRWGSSAGRGPPLRRRRGGDARFHLPGVPRPRSRQGLLRNRRREQLRITAADDEDSAAPQSLRQGRNVRQSAQPQGACPGDNGPTGPQVRGTGFTNEGSIDTLFRFLDGVVFDDGDGGVVGFVNGDPQRRAVEQYLLAFDSDLALIVGQQITLRSDNAVMRRRAHRSPHR